MSRLLRHPVSLFLFSFEPEQTTNPGLPLLQTPSPASQETYFITLSELQTTAVLHAIKQIVGPDSNITHLCHAAMVLAMLRSNPLRASPSSGPISLYSPCWLNGRRYLRSCSDKPSPTVSYIPNCLSFAPIIFKDLQDFILPLSAPKPEIRSMLIRTCRVATMEYSKIKQRKSMLPECITLFEDLGQKMFL